MRAAVLLAVTVGAAGGPFGSASAVGQAPPEDRTHIEDLVQAYRSGSYEQAAAAATVWSAERTTLEIGRLIAEETPREDAEESERTRLAAAAILAESALARLRSGDRRLLAPGLWAASLLLEERPLGERGRAFAPQLYLLAGLVLHWHVEIEAGHRLLAKALRHFPDDAELHTALGSMLEQVASLRTYPSPPGGSPSTAGRSRSYSSERAGYRGVLFDATLPEAAAHYERALLSDPGHDEARLRLARVRLLMGRTEGVLADLERVATEAGQPRQRYLARLFAGDARQRQGDLAGAVETFRACVDHGPRAQTVFLALGRALDERGDAAGAQEAFASASALDAPFDPWWSYGAGQMERCDELVAELRRLLR